MVAITGAQTNAALKVASTWGTAVAASTGNKIAGEISFAANGSELIARQIGSGNYMATDATLGATAPTVTITGDVGYRNNFDTIVALLMQTSGAPAEVTGGQADYKHTITFGTSISKYGTFAFESTSSTTIEFPTAAVRSLTIRTTNVPGYLEYTAELLANKIELASATNTNAVIAAATLTDTELAAVAFDDDFWIDTQASGALASGDQLNITGYELTLTRPIELVGEIKGAAGNSAPVVSDLFEGTLSITSKELAAHTYFTAWEAGTAYKSRFAVEGTQIGTGTNKAVVCLLPRMVLVELPDYPLGDSGINPVTYTFRLLKASANPTGMSSTYPYFEITNGLSTSLLA